MIAAPGKYYVYAVIDKAASPPAVVAVRLSRQEANKERQRMIDDPLGSFGLLRVRRARMTLFET